jgi:hypothetical protein
MMTRKDYVATAEILLSYKEFISDEFAYQDMVYDFSDMFLSDNKNFNPMTFKIACGL